MRINREVQFFIDMYTTVMKEYKVAMHKWKMGTGGGSGEKADYANWDSRDKYLFANYGGGFGRRISKDYRGYLYMLDYEAGFPFSCSFAPPPPDAIMEDGTGVRATSKRKGSSKNDMIEKVGVMMGGAIEKSVKGVGELLMSLHEKEQGRGFVSHTLEDGDNEGSTDFYMKYMEQMERAMTMLEKYEKEVVKVEESNMEVGLKRRKLASLQRSVKNAEKVIEKINNKMESLP